MAEPIELLTMRTESARRLGNAFAISILAHALLLSWPISLPAAGLIGTIAPAPQRPPAKALTVSIASPLEEARTDRPIESPLDPPVEQAPLVIAAGEKPKNEPQGGAENSIPLVGYYPAEKLTRMPEAVSIFRVEPPSGGDAGLAGKVTLRLWIGADGAVDRVRVIDNGLPRDYADAARAAFENMRFDPGQIAGIPVRTWVDVVIEYADFRDAVSVEAAKSGATKAAPAK